MKRPPVLEKHILEETTIRKKSFWEERVFFAELRVVYLGKVSNHYVTYSIKS
jgi:hypothetical protein